MNNLTKLECLICGDALPDIFINCCGHPMHWNCLVASYTTKECLCPFCRSTIECRVRLMHTKNSLYKGRKEYNKK